MNQKSQVIIVISNPHILHFKKIVKKSIKREKNYYRYSELFDYLYNHGRLEILRSGNYSSFRKPNLAKLFTMRIFNNFEFFIWLYINRLHKLKIKVYKDISEIDASNRVILDFSATWHTENSEHLQKLVQFQGIVLIQMTHYFKNSQIIFNTLSKFKKPVLISEGNVTRNSFFRMNVPENMLEITVPFVIDELEKKGFKKTDQFSKNGKCLIMGTSLCHFNIDLLNFYSTEFLNPDRVNFRNLVRDNSKFTLEPSDVQGNTHNFQKDIRELYWDTSLFFTGVEIIGLPSINTFEGMYFGALYIGPEDSTHRSLGFVNGVNYLSYKPGDFTDFLKVVDSALLDQEALQRISKKGQDFILENFRSKQVYGNLIKQLDDLVFNSDIH